MIAVAYRDRICRCGFELAQSLCPFHGGTNILVHHASEIDGGDQSEPAEKLLAACNFYVAQNNGRRGGRGKNRLRTEGQAGEAEPVSCMEEMAS